MANKTIGIIIALFVAVLMGVVLVSIIADTTQKATTLTTTSETVDVSNARAYAGVNDNANASYRFHLTQGCQEATGWKADITGTCQDLRSITNATGVALTANTDYAANDTNIRCTGQSSGDFRLLNSTGTIASLSSGLNTTTVTYGYCDSGYVSVGWAQTMLNLVPGFFALAIFIGAAFVMFKILESEQDVGVN